MRRKARQRRAYPFEIAVNDPELVEVGHTRCDIRELKVINK